MAHLSMKFTPVQKRLTAVTGTIPVWYDTGMVRYRYGTIPVWYDTGMGRYRYRTGIIMQSFLNILSELDRNYRYVPGGQEIKVEKLSRRPDYPLGQVQPATQLEGLAGRERRNLKLHSVFKNKTMKK